MDFDDILINMVKLLEQNPDIAELYREKFRYVMVDEYQDTNMPQYRAVMQLAKGNGNICVVGDDDQSIYSFRGADVRLILKFEKDFPGARVIKLEENYRSTKTILDAANCVIDKQ
jgi:Superfamily I DNA and RNA helicases